MKKVLNILLIVIVLTSCIFITGCDKKEEKEIKTVSSIKLNKEQYIKQLKEIKINNTKDTLKITKKVKWKVPKEADGNTTVSFSIAIPYIIKVDGKEYKGTYQLNNYETSKDDNPKYNFKIVNLTKNGDISVYITKK